MKVEVRDFEDVVSVFQQLSGSVPPREHKPSIMDALYIIAFSVNLGAIIRLTGFLLGD